MIGDLNAVERLPPVKSTASSEEACTVDCSGPANAASSPKYH